MNLPSKQEEGAITLLKQFSYDAQEIISQLLEELHKDSSKTFKYNNNLLEVREDVN